MVMSTGMATWLHNHVAIVAHQEDGAFICDEIERMCRNIIRIVNCPPEPMTLGPCVTDPAPMEVLAGRAAKGDNTTRCAYAPTAPSHSGSVTCPQCETVRLIDDVLAHNLGEFDDRIATVRELVDVVLPRLDEHVPQSTVERWIRRGWVPVRGRDAQGIRWFALVMCALSEQSGLGTRRARQRRSECQYSMPIVR
ncbi:Bacteriophage protein [Mycobacteroides abscessus subsp. abscessus]|nr:Bacteriophage protein [Mycobacteroides abscessus subsp. abscessus]SLE16331.1 Bacteriophage protein [Mycobacteroides abscessus subsp. abscessus]